MQPFWLPHDDCENSSADHVCASMLQFGIRLQHFGVLTMRHVSMHEYSMLSLQEETVGWAAVHSQNVLI